jgi:hypothetical protein
VSIRNNSCKKETVIGCVLAYVNIRNDSCKKETGIGCVLAYVSIRTIVVSRRLV